LFSLYFQPQSLKIANWIETIRFSFREATPTAVTAPNRAKQDYFGIYPFRWQPKWEKSFEVLHGNGRIFVAPILQTLILNRAPQATLAWANRVAQWSFDRIIPCHFDAPIAANPEQFRAAFDFLDRAPTIDNEDVRLLQQIDRQLTWWRLILPRAKSGDEK
jgi:hypothetical protein